MKGRRKKFSLPAIKKWFRSNFGYYQRKFTKTSTEWRRSIRETFRLRDSHAAVSSDDRRKLPTALSLLNPADRQQIADRIDSQLSPENLSCDGELPAAEVRRRYRNLTRCAEELLSIDPSVKMYEFG